MRTFAFPGGSSEEYIAIDAEYDQIENGTNSRMKAPNNDIPVIRVTKEFCIKDMDFCDDKLHQDRSFIARTIFWILATSHGIWQVREIILCSRSR